jgi:hypothetical protein
MVSSDSLFNETFFCLKKIALTDSNPTNKKNAEKPPAPAPVSNVWQNPTKSEAVIENNLNDSQTIALLQRLQIKPLSDAKVEQTTSELQNESKESGDYKNIWNELKKPNSGKSLPKPPQSRSKAVLEHPKPVAVVQSEPAPGVNAETNTLMMMLGIGKQGENDTNLKMQSGPIVQVIFYQVPNFV